MKVQPVKIEFKTVYENRHLYTDDVEYNSLVISNLINKNVILLDVQIYHSLDDNSKQYVFDENPRFNYILSKNGLYRQQGVLCSYSLGFYAHWRDTDMWAPRIIDRTIDILTILNEEQS